MLVNFDTKTDEHIWAETYDKDETDIFELQSEVAIEIAEAMKSELTFCVNEKSTIAYEYYLKGRMPRMPDILRKIYFWLFHKNSH